MARFEHTQALKSKQINADGGATGKTGEDRR